MYNTNLPSTAFLHPGPRQGLYPQPLLQESSGSLSGDFHLEVTLACRWYHHWGVTCNDMVKKQAAELISRRAEIRTEGPHFSPALLSHVRMNCIHVHLTYGHQLSFFITLTSAIYWEPWKVLIYYKLVLSVCNT